MAKSTQNQVHWARVAPLFVERYRIQDEREYEEENCIEVHLWPGKRCNHYIKKVKKMAEHKNRPNHQHLQADQPLPIVKIVITHYITSIMYRNFARLAVIILPAVS